MINNNQQSMNHSSNLRHYVVFCATICVYNHEQPRRGESLFASTERPVYRLSPLYPEGKGDLGESGGAPSLRIKKGTGDDFRKSPSRRGLVR